MIRKLHCEKCGTKAYVPCDPEDYAAGWRVRAVWLKARKPEVHQIKVLTANQPAQVIDLPMLHCDHCNNEIKNGDRSVAITMWRGPEPRAWESEFGVPEGTAYHSEGKE
jgi:hypothetical protein